MTRVALLTIGDGRDDLLAATLASLEKALEPACGGIERFATRVHVDDRQHRLGFCGAIRAGWDRLRALDQPFDFVLHLEEDWQFDAPVDLAGMAMLLDSDQSLAQVALRRGAHGSEPPGGFLEQWPLEFEERMLIIRDDMPRFLVHRLFFTTNPSLYRRRLLELDWPAGPGCERVFGDRLVRDGHRFAYWGARDDPPAVTHTGTIRTGKGY